MRLTLGGGITDRRLDDAEDLLRGYDTDVGLHYLDYNPATDPDCLQPEDLAVTILINSRVSGRAFKSVQDRGQDLHLCGLPSVPLEQSSPADRDAVADLIAQVATWEGFAASVATKILHKKRPSLIPILDNQAIFGAYMNPRWPARRASTSSVYARTRIRHALELISIDLTRQVNRPAWERLAAAEGRRSRIELFDMVWWVHFRRLEPVRPASPV
jgi:uncharacterized protein (DUF2342 family)